MQFLSLIHVSEIHSPNKDVKIVEEKRERLLVFKMEISFKIFLRKKFLPIPIDPGF